MKRSPIKVKLKVCEGCGLPKQRWKGKLCKACAAKQPKKEKLNPSISRGLEKEKGISALVQVLQPLTNKLVRLMNADSRGVVKCCLCPNSGQWDSGTMHGAHYMPSVHWGTRFELDNIVVACQDCNYFDDEQQQKIRAVLVNTLGEERVRELEKQAHTSPRFSRDELANRIAWTREQVLEQLKRFK